MPWSGPGATPSTNTVTFRKHRHHRHHRDHERRIPEPRAVGGMSTVHLRGGAGAEPARPWCAGTIGHGPAIGQTVCLCLFLCLSAGGAPILSSLSFSHAKRQATGTGENSVTSECKSLRQCSSTTEVTTLATAHAARHARMPHCNIQHTPPSVAQLGQIDS
jgi:hypothetical protein